MNLTAEDVRDRVADLLPGIPETELGDACEWFAAQLNAEHTAEARTETDRAHAAGLVTMATADPRAFDGVTGGGVEIGDLFSYIPDAWAGAHTVKVGRNKRGPTRLVVRRGMAPVVGRVDTDVHGRPLLAECEPVTADVRASLAARLLCSRDIHLLRAGRSSLDVTRITNDAYRDDDGLEPLIGTDAEVWSQVIAGDASSLCAVARHTTDIADGASPDLAWFAVAASVHVSHTSRLKWAPRLTLPIGNHRRGETTSTAPRTITRCAGHGMQTHGYETVTITSIVAPTTTPDTHRFIGHVRVPRPMPVEINGRRHKTAARTIGHTDTEPTTVDGWAELLDVLNRGERVTIGDHVTVTRGKAGKYRATDKRGDTVTYWETRTSEALALRLT